MDNLLFTFKKGEVGKEMGFTIKADGAAYNLDTPTNFTITLAIAKTKNTDPVVTGATVTKRNQTTLTGQCYHTLDATTANIPIGIYKACELKLTQGSRVLYWPCDSDDNRTYFTIEVQKPIS